MSNKSNHVVSARRADEILIELLRTRQKLVKWIGPGEITENYAHAFQGALNQTTELYKEILRLSGPILFDESDDIDSVIAQEADRALNDLRQIQSATSMLCDHEIHLLQCANVLVEKIAYGEQLAEMLLPKKLFRGPL